MAYCTQQDLIDRFGQDELLDLTDIQRTGEINHQTVQRAIEDAESLIDGFLASRYQLPLSAVPKSLTPIACNIARYQLYDEQTTDTVERRYKDAMNFLKAVSKGEVVLGVTADGVPTASEDTAIIESQGSVFSRQSSKGYI